MSNTANERDVLSWFKTHSALSPNNYVMNRNYIKRYRQSIKRGNPMRS